MASHGAAAGRPTLQSSAVAAAPVPARHLLLPRRPIHQSALHNRRQAARLTASASPHPRNSKEHTNAMCPASDATPGRAPEGAYLVSGAAGFIGSHLVEALLLRGWAVVAVDSMDQGGPYPRNWKEANVALLHRAAKEHAARGARLAFHQADAGDRAAIRALFAGDGAAGTGMPPVSRVCHLGARSGVPGSVEDPAGAVAANVASTAVLLDLAAAAQCRAFVLASSGSVYGECSVDAAGQPVPSTEGDSTAAPVSPYAATKRAAELMAHAFWHMTGVPVTVARIFTVYGPRGRPDMAVYRFITAVLAGAPLTRFGDGRSTWRDYTHVDDVVAGLIAALHTGEKNSQGQQQGLQGRQGQGRGERGESAGEGDEREGELGEVEVEGGAEGTAGFVILNLASGVPTRLGELIGAVEAAVGGTPANVTELPQRAADVGGTYADVSAAKRVLGWAAELSLEEGMRRTALWYTSPEAQTYGAPQESLRS